MLFGRLDPDRANFNQKRDELTQWVSKTFGAVLSFVGMKNKWFNGSVSVCAVWNPNLECTFNAHSMHHQMNKGRLLVKFEMSYWNFQFGSYQELSLQTVIGQCLQNLVNNIRHVRRFNELEGLRKSSFPKHGLKFILATKHIRNIFETQLKCDFVFRPGSSSLNSGRSSL